MDDKLKQDITGTPGLDGFATHSDQLKSMKARNRFPDPVGYINEDKLPQKPFPVFVTHEDVIEAYRHKIGIDWVDAWQGFIASWNKIIQGFYDVMLPTGPHDHVVIPTSLQQVALKKSGHRKSAILNTFMKEHYDADENIIKLWQQQTIAYSEYKASLKTKNPLPQVEQPIGGGVFPCIKISDITIETIIKYLEKGRRDSQYLETDEATIFFNNWANKKENIGRTLAIMNNIYSGSSVETDRATGMGTHRRTSRSVRLGMYMLGQLRLLDYFLQEVVSDGFAARTLLQLNDVWTPTYARSLTALFDKKHQDLIDKNAKAIRMYRSVLDTDKYLEKPNRNIQRKTISVSGTAINQLLQFGVHSAEKSEKAESDIMQSIYARQPEVVVRVAANIAAIEALWHHYTHHINKCEQAHKEGYASPPFDETLPGVTINTNHMKEAIDIINWFGDEYARLVAVGSNTQAVQDAIDLKNGLIEAMDNARYWNKNESLIISRFFRDKFRRLNNDYNRRVMALDILQKENIILVEGEYKKIWVHPDIADS